MGNRIVVTSGSRCRLIYPMFHRLLYSAYAIQVADTTCSVVSKGQCFLVITLPAVCPHCDVSSLCFVSGGLFSFSPFISFPDPGPVSGMSSLRSASSNRRGFPGLLLSTPHNRRTSSLARNATTATSSKSTINIGLISSKI